jgi:hypothetical protein
MQRFLSSIEQQLPPLRHLEGAEVNLAFGDALRKAGASDPAAVGWAITALFYSALHVVRAYAATKGDVITSHEDMRSLIHARPELKSTHPSYQNLKQQSEKWRYYLDKQFTWADYDEIRKHADRILKTWKPKVEAWDRQQNQPRG